MTQESPQTQSKSLLARHPWLVFVLPFAVYMLLGQIEPAPYDPSASADSAATTDTQSAGRFAQRFGYPSAYALKLVLTGLALGFVFPVYRAFPLRVHWLSVPLGVFGGFFWILLCRLQLESRLFQGLGIGQLLTQWGLESWAEFQPRPMFNPYATFDEGGWLLFAFIAIRLLGLVAIVPLIEEFFLRGFLIRMFGAQDWLKVPIGALTGGSFAIMLLYAVGTHPGEWIAAILWFSMVSLLILQTRNIWDAVALHLTTNLVLGIYILTWQDWQLW